LQFVPISGGSTNTHHSTPVWKAFNANKPKPIIIDLVLKPFRGSPRSIELIFVHAEHSKKQEAGSALQEIYDGSSEAYPRGDILLFVSVMSKLEDDYTPA
jgi:hypothetical protein